MANQIQSASFEADAAHQAVGSERAVKLIEMSSSSSSYCSRPKRHKPLDDGRRCGCRHSPHGSGGAAKAEKCPTGHASVGLVDGVCRSHVGQSLGDDSLLRSAVSRMRNPAQPISPVLTTMDEHIRAHCLQRFSRTFDRVVCGPCPGISGNRDLRGDGVPRSSSELAKLLFAARLVRAGDVLAMVLVEPLVSWRRCAGGDGGILRAHTCPVGQLYGVEAT